MTNASAQSILFDQSVTIRPLRATDFEIEGEFVRNLSAQTKHYRFFGGVNELPAAELRGLCDVDGCASMAFVATAQRNGHETAIGVSRYVPSSKEHVREMALTIADDWQHKGLAELLVNRLIAHAKSQGVQQLYSVELADNSAMRELAGKLGMSASRDPQDSNQVIYSIKL